MEGHTGAVVVMDPRNGDLLAMVSTPAFDVDRFTESIDRSAWLRVVQDPHFPLMNRAVQGQYAPASIFKILVAAAGLQEGSLTPGESTHCTGEFQLGPQTFRDWKERSEEHTSELQSQSNLVCRLLLEKKKKQKTKTDI